MPPAMWSAFPSLASVSMEQGRIAAARAFDDNATSSNPSFYPYGIYTIPEISFIGKTEEQLTDEDVPYEVGMAYYREVARGQIRGDTTGRLKLIFHRDTRKVLGVHIIGEGASELVHIGQAVMIARRHGRLLYRNCLQLPDARRVLQGRRVQWPGPLAPLPGGVVKIGLKRTILQPIACRESPKSEISAWLSRLGAAACMRLL